jgi:hypothetical protein
MIAVPFTEVSSTSRAGGHQRHRRGRMERCATTYALSAVVSKNKRRWVSLQAGNLKPRPRGAGQPVVG